MADSLGSWLREKRKTAGLSMREAGQLAGVSEGWISKIEAGKKPPSADLLVRLAQAYGVQPAKALQRAGVLDRDAIAEAAARIPFDDYVRGDPNLSAAQKRQLKSLYALFTRPGR